MYVRVRDVTEGAWEGTLCHSFSCARPPPPPHMPFHPGADRTIKDAKGKTALAWAQINSYTTIVQLLLKDVKAVPAAATTAAPEAAALEEGDCAIPYRFSEHTQGGGRTRSVSLCVCVVCHAFSLSNFYIPTISGLE